MRSPLTAVRRRTEMAEKRKPLYLGRSTYRRRRLIDAQRLLPFLMFVLTLLPLLWGGGETGEPVGQGTRAVIHIFAVWGLVIVASAVLSSLIGDQEPSSRRPDHTPLDNSTVRGEE